MIAARSFVEAAAARGFRLYSGVPCSYLTPFINYVIASDALRYVGAVNEGDAVAIGAGAELGGQRSVVIFQNSGLGNAVSPLSSLTYTFRIPVLLVPTLRGEPGGAPDEPQHELMGRVTTAFLEQMNVAWEYFPREEEELEPAIERAVTHMEKASLPYALVMRKGSVAPEKLAQSVTVAPPAPAACEPARACATRREILAALQAAAGADDLVVASTGYLGRELYALEDRPNQLYMVGSMGCASSLGLGLAIARPERRVIVVDGDGAALMRLGALCTLGHERPPNLIHLVLDNRMHESTGGQATVSGTVSFPALAKAAGYPRVASLASPTELADAVAGASGELTFVHVPIEPGTPDGLPRPRITPPEVAARLRRFLAAPTATASSST